MKKIILINPPVSNDERYGDLKVAGSYSPPIGLAQLAAVTEPIYNTYVIDAPAGGLGID